MKASLIGFLCLTCMPYLFAGQEHDIHISLCEMRFNESSSSFEVSLKIFIDDLETAIREEKKVTGLHIGTAKEIADAEGYIADYISHHFSITIDDVRLIPSFLGKEVSEDLIAVWCYIEFKLPDASGKKCTVSNDILMHLYADQKNIMDIRMSAKHKDYTILESGRYTWNYTY